MRYTLEAGWSLRYIKRCPVDRRLAGSAFGAVELAAVVFADAPCGIVRWRGDDADFMPSRGKPGGHLTGVFADASKLGGVVDAVDQDSHLWQCKGECLGRSLRFPAGWLHSVNG